MLLGAAPLAAQSDTTARPAPRPPAARPDTAPRDTTARDTLPPRDTLPADTARDTVPHFLPVLPARTAPGPLPHGDRYVFPRDSLVMSDVVTLADLLNHIPGVYVVRGGFFGAAEPVIYGGRGAEDLEVYLDGVPYLPLGRDSVWLDPARIPLGPLERVEVQVLPGSLRVYLISARQRSTFATSEVDVKTGQFSTTGYRGGFAKRWRSGAGLTLGADYSNTNGDPSSTTTPFNSVDLWLGGEYVPTGRLGVGYQLISSAWDRQGDDGEAVVPWTQKRTDGLLRAFYATRDDGLGFRAQLAFATTTVSGDTVLADRSMRQGQIDLSETLGRASAGLTTTLGSGIWPLRLDGHANWMPLPWITLAADGRHAEYRGGRHGTRAHGAVGVVLPLGFSLRGDAAWARDLQAPALPQDHGQRTVDLSGAVRWESRLASLEVGGARLDPFRPIGFAAGIEPVTALAPVPRTTVATIQASLHPYAGFTLSGWYYEPTAGGGDFTPPHHARYSLTFDSKFWRVFRSGIFELRAEYAGESWSRSPLGGLDSATALPMRGATFTEANLQMRIAGVTVFWLIRNNNYMRSSYLVGADYPKNAQVYGVRWTFNN